MNLTIALGATALFGVGVTENVNGGFDVGGEFRGELMSFGVGFRGMPPATVYARERIDVKAPYEITKADVSEWTVLLTPCIRYKWFTGCGVAQGGLLVWQAATRESAPVLNFGPRVGFEVPFAGRFAFIGFGEALVRAIRPIIDLNYSLDPAAPPANTSWASSPVVGVFGAGLVVKLN